MELRHLRYFVSVVEEGSLHGASRRLNVAQPALSRRLRDLEAELGAILLFRSARGVRPSPAGAVFFDHVKAMLDDLDAATERTKRISLGRMGSLRIGYSAMATELRFPIAALSRLKDALPDVELKLSVVRSEDQLPALKAGRLDVGILFRPSMVDEQLAYRDLRTTTVLLAVPKRHPFANRKSVRVEELRGSQLILPLQTGAPTIFSQLLAACRRFGIEPLTTQEAQSETARLSMVAAGLALAFNNSSILERGVPDDVAFIPIADLDLEIKLAVMWPAGTETPLLQAFLNALAAADHALSEKQRQGA